MRRSTSLFWVLATVAALAACSSDTVQPDGKGKPGDSKITGDTSVTKGDYKIAADHAVDRARDSGPRPDLLLPDSPPPEPVAGWAVSGGGTGGEMATTLVLDSVGNMIITGLFAGTATFGSTTLTAAGYKNTGVFVAKLDPTGKYLWAVDLQGAGDLPLSPGAKNGLAVDSAGNIFVAATFAGKATFGSTTLTAKGDHDVFVAKLDSTGKVVWAIGVGGTGADTVGNLALDASGNITIVGGFDGPATFGTVPLTSGGESDGFIARLDGTGKVLWAAQAYTSGNSALQVELISGLAVDSAGNAYVSGQFYGKLTLGGVKMIAGVHDGWRDSYVAKLDVSGQFVWVSSYDTGISSLYDLVLDSSGNLYLAGGLESSYVDVVVAKVDASGNFVWVTTAPNGVSGAGAWGLQLARDDASGNIYVVGQAGGTTTFGKKLTLTAVGDQDAFVAKLSSSGTWLAAQRAGGCMCDTAASVKICGTDLCIAGWYTGKAQFTGNILTSKGGADAFVWRHPAP